jgi:hypothetical protein
MTGRGRPILQAWEQRLLDERLDVHVTERCALCDWTTVGALRTTRDAFLQHRTTEHPEVRPKPRRTRYRPHGMVLSSNLTDNVANARAQGAAGWAGAA